MQANDLSFDQIEERISVGFRNVLFFDKVANLLYNLFARHFVKNYRSDDFLDRLPVSKFQQIGFPQGPLNSRVPLRRPILGPHI